MSGRIVFGQVIRMDDVLGQVVGPLFAIDPDGTDAVQLVSCEVERPRISPDGSRLAFSIAMDDGTWQVATSAADGTDMSILTNTKGLAETPDWSPDGSWLVYALGDEPCDPWPDCIETGVWQYTLWRMNADGSEQQQIGDPDEIDWEPRVSPDGEEVLFTRYVLSNDLEPTLMIRDLETGAERSATADDQRTEHADWSPDGSHIVYNTYYDETKGFLERIKRVSTDNADNEPVVLYGDYDHTGYKATYSPDGSRIVFGCDAAMCVMDADGSNVVEVLRVAGVEFNHFSWGINPQ